MKGEIFRIFESFIIERWSESVFEKIYANSKEELTTKVPFVGPGTYPDQDFFTLVRHALPQLGVDGQSAVRAFGRFLFPQLLKRLPPTLVTATHPRDLLKSLDSVVHVEVRKIYPDATPPRFSYVEPSDNRLMLRYQSKRRLYDLVDGLLDALGAHFNVPMTWKRTIMEDETCWFDITFGTCEKQN